MGQDIKKIEKKNNNMQRQTINRKNLLVVVEELLVCFLFLFFPNPFLNTNNKECN